MKLSNNCSTCPLEKFCPIPKDSKSPIPKDMLRKILCPKNEDGRKIRCADCIFLRVIHTS